MKDDIKPSEPTEEDTNKIDSKRMKSRIRSRKARERKKIYIDELETKIRTLEAENSRLQNLLIQYKKEESLNTNEESQSLIEEIRAYKDEILRILTNSQNEKSTQDSFVTKSDEKPDILGKEFFSKANRDIFDKHSKLLEHSFDVIFENYDPVLSYLEEDYQPRYDLVVKYQKLRKFEKIDFVRKYNFSELDQLLASLSNLLILNLYLEPNKRQFSHISEVFLKKAMKIKKNRSGRI